jgi:hypothetical protein
MRLLFSSIHCYLDPASGAALCTRELLELLAARGMDCRVLTTGVLDPERETTRDELFATLELPIRRFQAELGTGRAAEVTDLSAGGVRVTLMPTASSRAERSPDSRESAIYLELAESGLCPLPARPCADPRWSSGQSRADATGATAENFRRVPPAQFRLERTEGEQQQKRSQGLCRRLDCDFPFGILPPPPCPAWVWTVRSSPTRSCSTASWPTTPSRSTTPTCIPSCRRGRHLRHDRHRTEPRAACHSASDRNDAGIESGFRSRKPETRPDPAKPTKAPHRSERADFLHPDPHLMPLPARSGVVA